jgi:selenocysteine-specific elongation factor
MTSEQAPPQVIATAGHVDHGKSALILRLTGMDPDRLAEEKRRGLTIDLGFAWGTLPSGREIGFVDVPGHERFIRNMLAGVGPVRLVLFVVAADEGWKPQSEEHLQIIDVLGVEGAVVALTKRDLVDAEALRTRSQEIRARLEGTRVIDAPIVACSAQTGEGIKDLLDALDAMVGVAPAPETGGRPRQFIDRVFTIRGSGTVVTGTLTGGDLTRGAEAEVLPGGHRARIRGLQTHRRAIDRARPVSRVAVNLAGTATADLGRGDVLVLPGQWLPTTAFEALVEPVRGLAHAVSSRGAFKLYAGSAERDARVRFYTESKALDPSSEGAFARISVRRSLVLDRHDRFVLREAGRRETVAGGRVVDAHPPARAGADTVERLTQLDIASPEQLPRVLLTWRRIVPSAELLLAAGALPDDGALRLGRWLLSDEAAQRATAAAARALAAHHAEHPLRPGMEMEEMRAALARHDPAFADAALADAFVATLGAGGIVAREATSVRLPTHGVSTAGSVEADRMVAAVTNAGTAPPTVRELTAAGYDLELIGAVCAEGRLVRVAPDLVMTPSIIERALELIRTAGPNGMTVSDVRQALGTSRKYAVPLLEHLDARGLTRRVGDVRVARG